MFGQDQVREPSFAMWSVQCGNSNTSQQFPSVVCS